MTRRLATGARFASALIWAGTIVGLPSSISASSDGPVGVGGGDPAGEAVIAISGREPGRNAAPVVELAFSARTPAADGAEVVDIGISGKPPAPLAAPRVGPEVDVLPQSPPGHSATPFPATGVGIVVALATAGGLVTGGALLLASGRHWARRLTIL